MITSFAILKYIIKTAFYIDTVVTSQIKKMSPCGQNDFTSSVLQQTACGKELQQCSLCLTAKSKSFRNITGSGRIFKFNEIFRIKI